MVINMKIIRHYKNQSIEVEKWLKHKGYRKNRGGYLHFGDIFVKGKYYTLWHVYTNNKAFIIAEEIAGNFDILIIKLNDISTTESIYYFLETGNQPEFEDWFSFTTKKEQNN